jgi:hypothetical protein
MMSRLGILKEFQMVTYLLCLSNPQPNQRILTTSFMLTVPTIWRIRAGLTLYLHNDRRRQPTGEAVCRPNEALVYGMETDSHQVKVHSWEPRLLEMEGEGKYTLRTSSEARTVHHGIPPERHQCM